MGNIKILQRKKDDKLIDDLILEYNGNQLKTVADVCGSQNQHAVKEYQDKDNGQQEFGYDANGNMMKDLDRGIVMIKYNLLNLPDTIQFSTGDQIINKYNAGGEKLYTHYVTLITKLVHPLVESCIMNYSNAKDEVMITGNEYIGDMEYETNCYYDETLQKNIYMYAPTKLYNPEGYLTLNGYPRYFAYRKDHLGNVREVWRSASESDVYRPAVVQRTQYYASGLPWAESLNAELQNRKYNGKEWVETHGYDTYDYDARGYYAAIQRFTTMDPLTEKYYNMSSYVYCHDNPMNMIDPDGRGDYYTKNGIWLGSDGKDDDLAYTSSNVERDENGIVTEADNQACLKYKNSQLIKLAAVAYAESDSKSNYKEELYGIASACVNNYDERKGKNELSEVLDEISCATHDGNKNYNKFNSTSQQNKNKNAKMQKSIAAAINAMTDGIDYSNGATGWDGADLPQNSHRFGLNISNPEHDIFKVGDRPLKNPVNGSYYKRQTTAAHGRTVFIRIHPRFIKGGGRKW